MMTTAPMALREAVRNGYPLEAGWDGHEMLVVSKVQTKAPVYCDEIGAAYDPVMNAWRALPSLHGASGCFDPLTWDQVVWTGKEMLLWGITNAAFNPSTNRWRKLPDPPTGWGGPSFAVWTGRQMIGWGGGGGDLVLNDGAAYTPATNSWKMLPPARLEGTGRDTTGVWTGSELIIAGGEAPSDRGERFFSDAAAYDPATKSWRRLAPLPLAMAGTAIWDGTRVLLIRGTTRNETRPGTTRDVPRGLAYDPSTDRWRWMSPASYPRGGAVAVWTGHELLVWGGLTEGGSIPPHGEIYDPATDTWSAMPRSPLRGRYPALGMWTGSSLIIWGGSDARTGDRLTDGATFTPASG